jgi:drug/metabolite transporter (DMT)-like permease
MAGKLLHSGLRYQPTPPPHDELDAVKSSSWLPPGVATIIVSVSAMALADAIVKASSSDMPLWQMWVLRSFMVLPPLLVLAHGHFMVREVFWLALRSFALVMMYLSIYAVLPVLDLSLVGAAFYTAPLFIAGFSALFLGNAITLRHWLALLTGFAGLLLVVKPFGAAFTPLIFLPVASAMFYAAAAIITRAKCGAVPVATMALWLNVAFVIFGSVASLILLVWESAQDLGYPFLFGSWTAMGLSDWGVIAALAVLMFIIAIGVAKAYQAPRPEVVASFEYCYMVSAVLWGYLFFGEFPDGMSFAGMALIATGGVAVLLVGKKNPASRTA